MSDIILVHGACHGAWCWRDVIPGLEARGHRVRALDMPGRGVPDDAGDLTLADQADTILAALDGPAVLVGHSAGGLSISAAAQAAPDKVQHLVYVAALLPRDGDSLGEMMQALEGERANLPITRTENRLGYCFDTDGAGPKLYNGATEDQMAWALPQICAEPSGPHRDRIKLGAAFDALPKSYIRCQQDLVIPAIDQTRLAADLPARNIHDLDTGHSPFLSEAPALTALIDQIAKEG